MAPKEAIGELLYARVRLTCLSLCLSIPKHTFYYPVVWHPLIHRADTVSRISVTLELFCALGYASSPTRTRGSARFYGTETRVFEHP